jgi:hypothetical protein
MTRFGLAALLFLSVPALAGDEPEITDREFIMPSRNIGCIVQDVSLEGGTGPSKRLYCARNLPTTIAVILDERGLETYPTEGDQPFSSEADILQYGENWYHEGFSCDSDQKGVLCNHSNYGAFRLSRKGVEEFK